MDSALSDPHNGSGEAGTPANGTTRPPSTPEGIALAYGSLLLMALLPIFFGALRSVRCARGKVGSGRASAFNSHPGHSPHGPVPEDPDSCPLFPRHSPTPVWITIASTWVHICDWSLVSQDPATPRSGD